MKKFIYIFGGMFVIAGVAGKLNHQPLTHQGFTKPQYMIEHERQMEAYRIHEIEASESYNEALYQEHRIKDSIIAARVNQSSYVVYFQDTLEDNKIDY